MNDNNPSRDLLLALAESLHEATRDLVEEYLYAWREYRRDAGQAYRLDAAGQRIRAAGAALDLMDRLLAGRRDACLEEEA